MSGKSFFYAKNPKIGGCQVTQNGCCSDGTTARVNEDGSNCTNIGGCAGNTIWLLPRWQYA